MEKQIVVYNGILLSDKRIWAVKPQKDIDESEMHIAKWKKLVLKKLHTVWFQLYEIWKRKNSKERKKIYDSQDFVGGQSWIGEIKDLMP